MRPHTIITSSITAIALVLASLLVGCSEPSTQSVPMCLGIRLTGDPVGQVSIIYGWRANTKTIPIDALECVYSQLIDRSSTSTVKIVVPQGRDTPSSTTNVPHKPDLGDDPAIPAWGSTRSWLLGLSPNGTGTQETDSLEALYEASSSFSSADTRRKVLVIADSLLSTEGGIDFTSSSLNDILYEDGIDDMSGYFTPSLISSIDHYKIDLSGVEVVMAGVGEVASPQATLTGASMETLKSFWGTILSERLHAFQPQTSSPALCSMPSPDPDVSQNDACDSVNGTSLPEVSKVYISPRVSPQEDKNACTYAVTLSSGSLQFVPNSQDQFVDGGSQAEKVVQQIASEMPFYLSCGAQIRVTGTSANDHSPSPTPAELAADKQWSIGRAITVRNLLITSLGSKNASNIKVCGAGFDFPGHVDEWPDGVHQDPYLAQQNMTVIIEALPAAEAATCE